MTIEKGQDWGSPADDASSAPRLAGDAELAAAAGRAYVEDRHLVAGLTGGDLLTTLGLPGTRPAAQRRAYPMDLGLAYLGDEPPLDEPLPFVAHLTVRRWPLVASFLGHGPGIVAAVMNAAWLDDLRLGPRAHPNDGVLDILEGRPPIQQRREALRRARSGSHLPHPSIRVTRSAAWHASFNSPASIWLDGVNRGRHRSVRVELVPDALTVIA